MEVKSCYATRDQIDHIIQRLNFSLLGDKKEIILEVYSLSRMANIGAREGFPAISFYFYIPNIQDIRVFLPLSYFEVEVLKILKVFPSQIMQNS